MKLIFRLLITLAVVFFILVTIIKIVQKCSYKEAFGTAEELLKELCIPVCCTEEEEASEEA